MALFCCNVFWRLNIFFQTLCLYHCKIPCVQYPRGSDFSTNRNHLPISLEKNMNSINP